MSRAPRPQGVVPFPTTASQSSTGVLGGAHQLDAAPRRCTRCGRSSPRRPRTSPIAWVNGGRLRQPERSDRGRALHREQRVVVRGVANLRAADLALLQPVVGGRAVACVDDEQGVERLDPVGDQVVDDPSALVREQRVLRLDRRRAGRGRSRADSAGVPRCFGPSTWICPMCETSNTPRSRLTARCSGITPSYCTGISQPANGTIRRAESDVTFMQRRPSQRLEAGSAHGATLDDHPATRTGRSRRGGCPNPDRQSSRRKLGISISASEVVGFSRRRAPAARGDRRPRPRRAVGAACHRIRSRSR